MSAPSPARTDLHERWTRLQAERPGIRIRTAAAELGVSEMELLTSNTDGTVTRLRMDFPRLLPRLNALGPVMA